MNKNARKIIALQARALDKAIKCIKIKKQRSEIARTRQLDDGYRRVLAANSPVFAFAANVCTGFNDLRKAAVVRALFAGYYFENYRSGDNMRMRAGRNWAICNHATTFSFKTHLTEAAVASKGGSLAINKDWFSSRNQIPDVRDWLYSPRLNKAAYQPKPENWEANDKMYSQ